MPAARMANHWAARSRRSSRAPSAQQARHSASVCVFSRTRLKLSAQSAQMQAPAFLKPFLRQRAGLAGARVRCAPVSHDMKRPLSSLMWEQLQ